MKSETFTLYLFDNHANLLGAQNRSFSFIHCVKSVRIWSYSGPYFPTFGVNTERYSIFLCINFECGKIRTRIISNTGTFYAVIVTCFSLMVTPCTIELMVVIRSARLVFA